MDIFVDEGGDLGISWPRSSRFFVVAMLATADPISLRRAVRKNRKRFKDARGRFGEFKFHRDGASIRESILRSVDRTDCIIAWTAVDKIGMKEHRKDCRGIYDLACAETLKQILQYSNAESVDITIDCRRSRTKQRHQLDDLIGRIIESHHSGYFAPEYRIRHLSSETSEGLQTIDFVVGAIFQKVERKDDTYSDIIDNKVVSSRII